MALLGLNAPARVIDGLFHLIDTDASNTIEYKELKDALQGNGVPSADEAQARLTQSEWLAIREADLRNEAQEKARKEAQAAEAAAEAAKEAADAKAQLDKECKWREVEMGRAARRKAADAAAKAAAKATGFFGWISSFAQIHSCKPDMTKR